MFDSVNGAFRKGFCTRRRLILDLLAVLPGLFDYQNATISKINNIAQESTSLEEKQAHPHDGDFNPVGPKGQALWRDLFFHKALV